MIISLRSTSEPLDINDPDRLKTYNGLGVSTKKKVRNLSPSIESLKRLVFPIRLYKVKRDSVDPQDVKTYS